jgi:alcohol dehydrogenase
MSYMKPYVEGKLPIYHAPDRPFIPGGNGVGTIHAVGEDIWHLTPGQRVVISSHVVAQENVDEPGQFLLGITAAGALARRMQADWPDGTLAEYACLPVNVVTPAEGLAQIDSTTLAVTARHLIPYGGLLRGRLEAGETLVVSGATGAYGTAAVLMGLAMGAGRVVAVGRNTEALDRLVQAAGPQVIPMTATGDPGADVERIRSAAGGGAPLAFDMVGGATDPDMTLAALRSLRRKGRLVLMGSMTVPLPIPYLELMLNSWELIGQFMYPRNAHRRLLDLIRADRLALNVIRPRVLPLAELPRAMELAASADSLECIVMQHQV